MSSVLQLDRSLLEAASRGQVEEIKTLLRAGAFIDAVDMASQTPLFLACHNGHRIAAEALIAGGASVNKPDANGFSPLLISVSDNRKELAEMLIRAGADVLMANIDSRTPLAVASHAGRGELVEMLLRAGADVHAADKFGWTPLFSACYCGHCQVAELLIRAGAKLDAQNELGWSPLHAAAAGGHNAVLTLLLSAGATVEIADKDARTPLLVACRAGQAKSVEILLQAKASMERADKDWETPLTAAIRLEKPDVIGVLLRSGAKPDAAALFTACTTGRAVVAEALVLAGANMEKANAEGKTPLVIACEASQPMTVRSLLRLGAMVPGKLPKFRDDAISMLFAMYNSPVLPDGLSRDSLFPRLAEMMAKRTDVFVLELVALGCPLSILKSVLFYEGRSPHPDVFRNIDATTFDADARDEQGETVLHWAARCTNASVIEEMIKAKKFNVNARDFIAGRTPLFLAATKEIYTKMVELGADVTAVDINGIPGSAMSALYSAQVPQPGLGVLDAAGLGSLSSSSMVAGSNLSKAANRILPTIVTVAVIDADGAPKRPNRKLAEVIVLAATLKDATPPPVRGISAADPLRPERFSWSQRRLDIEGERPRNVGELPMLWLISPKNAKQQLCIRIGDFEWVRHRKEPVDVVIFAHSIADPSGAIRVAQRVQEVRLLDGFQSAMMVLLGVGDEARNDKKLAEELTKSRSRLISADRCRSIAKNRHMNGVLECPSDPRALRDAVLWCTRLRLTPAAGAPPTAVPTLSLDKSDRGLLPPPLKDDEEIHEVKVLILGHQAGGKTTLLKRLLDEDTRKKSLISRVTKKIGEAAMAQPKSTVGIKFRELKSFSSPTTLRVLDFAGQPEYSTIHEHFLSPFNVIYVIVVNAAAENLRSQCQHWMLLLQTHGKGPRAGTALLVVGTMIDMVIGGAEAVEVRRKDILEEVTSWGIAKQFSRLECIMASNKTCQGLDDVFRTLNEMARTIGSTKVPHSLKRAQVEICKAVTSTHRPFVRLSDVPNLVNSEETRREIETHDAWEELLQHLHDVGLAVFEPMSRTVCFDVDVLAKMTSVFIAPPHHIGRMYNESGKKYFRSEIVPREEAIARMLEAKGVTKVLGEGSPEERRDQCTMAIEFMQRCRLCIELTEEEAAANHGQHGLMFPSLRVACDVISVPFLRVPDLEPGTRIAGARLRSSRKDLGPSAFSRVIVGLRALLDPKYTIFSNCAILRDLPRGTQILLALRSSIVTATPLLRQSVVKRASRMGTLSQSSKSSTTIADRKEAENELLVISFGRSPDTWRDSIGGQLFEICDLFDPLCPVCAQGDSYNVLQRHDGPLIGRNTTPAAPLFICAAGHEMASAGPEPCVEVSRELRRRELWSPAFGEAFFRTEPEKWSAWGNARITELTDHETDEARRTEYMRARAAFWNFVGADREEHGLTLTKIEFIQNDFLEERFCRFFDGLATKMLTRGASEQGMSAQLTGESEAQKSWRAWVLGQLEKSVMRVSGMEGINLILGWHGASDDAIHKISQTGFLEPQEFAAAGIVMTDSGYYAPGIYFTQFPSYGARYASMKKSNCLLVSWVLMGQAYPVIEPAGTLKSRVAPYNSHYVIVDQQLGFPCKPTDPPGSDEIVVFDKRQVLPRIIFHFEEAKHGQIPSSVNSPHAERDLPEELKAARPLILWVDQNLSSIDNTAAALMARLPKMKVIKCSSSSEASVWLARFGRQVSSRLAVISNRFRENDGGDDAWQRVVAQVREKGLEKVPVIVFCGSPDQVRERASHFKRVSVTSDPVELAQLLKKI